MGRDRSQAIVVRGDRILLVKHRLFDRTFFALPGGGIEAGETPEQAALRELEEECCVSGGKIIHPTSTQYKPRHRGAVYSFYVEIPPEAVPAPGSDPEVPTEQQTIIDVAWCSLEELSQRDQVALWSSGLYRIDYFYNYIVNASLDGNEKHT